MGEITQGGGFRFRRAKIALQEEFAPKQRPLQFAEIDYIKGFIIMR
jgi:hypothetical protein